jgi:ABC-type sugar transport system ATPase subunit
MSLSVRAGEVVGLYGLVGSGRSTFGRAIGGHFPFDCESLTVHGNPVSVRTPREAIASGICYITEDRHKEGFIPDFANLANMSLVVLGEYARHSVIERARERNLGRELKSHFQIKGELDELTTNLSGGNQQKICVSKWAASAADVIVIDEPSKGVDVGAKRQIYEIVEEFAAKGKAVILISSEAEELLHLADRTIVMVEYEVAAELIAGEYDKTQLISIALGQQVRETRKQGELA